MIHHNNTCPISRGRRCHDDRKNSAWFSLSGLIRIITCRQLNANLNLFLMLFPVFILITTGVPLEALGQSITPILELTQLSSKVVKATDDKNDIRTLASGKSIKRELSSGQQH